MAQDCGLGTKEPLGLSKIFSHSTYFYYVSLSKLKDRLFSFGLRRNITKVLWQKVLPFNINMFS